MNIWHKWFDHWWITSNDDLHIVDFTNVQLWLFLTIFHHRIFLK